MPERPSEDPHSLTKSDRILILAVHPDDESLSVGGLIQHALALKAKVHVAFITDGDNNPWPQRFLERRWRIAPEDRARWGERRRKEALAATACLGLSETDVSFWGFPDLALTTILMSGGGRLLPQLTDTIRAWRPSVVVGPSRHDQHPDHNSVAVLLDMALRQLGDESRAPVIWEYLVHGAADAAPAWRSSFVLSPEEVLRKRSAILCHGSQVALSRGRFLAFAGPVENFHAPDESARNTRVPRVAKAEMIDESLVLTLDGLRRPATILLSAQTADGPAAVTIRIPRFGDFCLCSGFPGKSRIQVPILHDAAIMLPGEPFTSASSLAIKFVSGWSIFDRSGWQQVKLIQSVVRAKRECMNVIPRTCCIIPCYNIAGVCGAVVREAARFADIVIAVNDGSTDRTEDVLREAAAEGEGKVEVLSFAQNRGKGVVMIEAFRHVLNTQTFDVLVTLDGDAQHRPEDIPRLARECVRGRYPLVIGERLERTKMPLRSRFGNTLTALLMKAFYPNAPTDTQSGLRAFRPDFLRQIVGSIEGGRYETELKILLLALSRDYSIGSVTIPTVYLAGNRLSHFRPLVDSWRIYRTLLLWRLEAHAEHADAISWDALPRA